MAQHTESIENNFLDVLEDPAGSAWKELGSIPDWIEKPGVWKNHFSKLVREYSFSGRFTLLRLIRPEMKMEEAEALSKEELKAYSEELLERVRQTQPEMEAYAGELLRRGLESTKSGTKSKLSREKLIELGHLLNLSMDEMQWVLLRALGDNEPLLRYSASGDIIDLYAFLRRRTLSEVRGWKAWYAENCAPLEKESVEQKSLRQTLDLEEDFPLAVKDWGEDPGEKQFRAWLTKWAPKLDLPPKSAQRVFLNLAALFYKKSSEFDATVRTCDFQWDPKSFEQDMALIADTDTLDSELYPKGKCDKNTADAIIAALGSRYINRIPRVEKDIVIDGVKNDWTNTRLKAILSGKKPPKKGDLLYLLWVILDWYWGYRTPEIDKVEKIFMLRELSNRLLKSACLSPFYPPCLLERTMLTSIVMDTGNAPSEIYESICADFAGRPSDANAGRKEGGKNYTKDEIAAILEAYDARPKNVTQKAFAAEKQVPESTLKSWINRRNKRNKADA